MVPFGSEGPREGPPGAGPPLGGGFAFGPFQLDVRSKRLRRIGTPVPLSDRHFDLLHAFVTSEGRVLSKENLLQAAWPDVIVGDNSLEVAISQLRRLLDADDLDRYIETVPRRGYRFVAPVRRVAVRRSDADLDALLAPHRAFLEGRAALYTLERSEIGRARSTFLELLAHHPDEATFHVGFANACVLEFEATRADPAPDSDALRLAAEHAHEACRLKPDYGEAWATLGFVLERIGDRIDAAAALRQAVTLEPDNWRHQLRLSFGSWGEERLRAARHTLALLPDCPLGRVLAATVDVARDALYAAEHELNAGIGAMPGESSGPARFSAVALYYIKGLLCLARGADEEALAAFEGELALEPRGHLYGRECCANTWYAIGACHLGRGDQPAARAAFEQAIARVPGHPMAHAGLALIIGTRPDGSEPPTTMEAATARAILLVADGDAAGAVRIVSAALAAAPPGNAGWLVPIEPLLGVQRDRAVWAPVLGTLRDRAT